MAQLASSNLFLVGSVPVASDQPEDVMRLCGRTLGTASSPFRTGK